MLRQKLIAVLAPLELCASPEDIRAGVDVAHGKDSSSFGGFGTERDDVRGLQKGKGSKSFPADRGGVEKIVVESREKTL